MNDESNQEQPPQQVEINTGGGTVFQQNVDTGGGNLIGRDQTINISGSDGTAADALGQGRQVVIGRDQRIRVRIGSLNVPRWFAIVIAVPLLLLLSVVSWYINRSIPPLAKMEGRLNIAIADFGVKESNGRIQDSNEGALLSNWLARTLDQELPKDGGSIPTFVVWQDQLNKPASNPPFNTITSAEQAEKLLGEDNIEADIVTFGYLDQKPGPANLLLNFVYKDPQIGTEPDGDLGRQRMGGAIPIPAKFKEILPDDELFVRARAIIGLSRGLAQEFAGHYQAAIDYYQQLDQSLPPEKWHSGREVLYYFAGRAAFQDRQLKLATSLFEKAKDQRHDYVSAYIGLGNVEYERAQLRLLLDQQADSEALAVCGGDALQQAIAKAQQDKTLPATLTDTITTTASAISYYQQALDASATYEWTPAQPIATYLLGNSIRFRGDLYWLTNQLDSANSDLQQAQTMLEAVVKPLESAQEPGYAAYSWQSLGYAQRTLALIAREQGQTDQALAAFADAKASFGHCQEYQTQSDSSGDTRYQQKAACYCGWWQKKVEEEEQQIPKEEKGSVG